MVLSIPKILLTNRYEELPLTIIQQCIPQGFSFSFLSDPSRSCLMSSIKDANYLLVSGRLRIDADVLDAAPSLKMIQRTGVGTDMLDLKEIKKRGIPVYINAGINARSVAEHTLALILSCLKHIPEINAQVHDGIWKKQITGVSTHELFHKTVGLVGMGNIGQKVAALLNAFGARVIYTDVIKQTNEIESSLNLTFIDSFEEMLPMVDILSFHCPLTENNVGILNSKTISLLKEGVIIINTARGALINPNDLYDAVLSGHIASAGLDTHFEEPISHNYKLAMLKNVILTPHIGGLSYEAFQSMMKGAIDNIVSFELGHLDLIAPKQLAF